MPTPFSATLSKSIETTSARGGPLNRRLYERLREQVLKGNVRPGAKLPSTRALAIELGVSRNTVKNAFDQLMAEGYLRSRRGSGTYVVRELPRDLSRRLATRKPAEADDGPRHKRPSIVSLRSDFAYTNYHVIRAFRPGVPGLDIFPYRMWTKLLRRQWNSQRAHLLGYASPGGFAPLRKAVASYLAVSRSVRCHPDQIIITSGIQQALHLISQILLKPGDPVWIEEPGYFAAQAVFEASAADLIPVELDSEGLSVSAGVAANPAARLVYSTPGHQFPLGTTMSIVRRLELLQWAARSKAWILEDDYDSEFRYSNRPVPALQGLDRNGSVIYAGSFSKLLFPGLRLGYIVVPPPLVDRVMMTKFVTDWHSSMIDQAVVAEFINQGHFARHIRKMRSVYMERLEALLDGLHSEAAGLLTVERPDCGMHLVAMLTQGIDDLEAATALSKGGVSSLPMSLCYLDRRRKAGLILGYAAYSPAQIKQGCRLLVAALEKLQKAS